MAIRTFTERKVLVIDWEDLSALEEALIRAIERVEDAIDNCPKTERATKLLNERGSLHDLLRALTK